MASFNQHLKLREQMLAAAEKIAARYDSKDELDRSLMVDELGFFYENFFLNCRRSNIQQLVKTGVLTLEEAKGHLEARAIFCEIHGFNPKLFD